MMRSFLFAILLVFSGCSIASNFYIRNLGSSATNVSLVAFENLNEKRFEFRITKDELKEIRFGSFEDFGEKVAADAKGNMITLLLPAHSTVYVGPGNNFRSLFEKALVGQDTLDLTRLNRFKKSKQFFNRYAVWYDIK